MKLISKFTVAITAFFLLTGISLKANNAFIFYQDNISDNHSNPLNLKITYDNDREILSVWVQKLEGKRAYIKLLSPDNLELMRVDLTKRQTSFEKRFNFSGAKEGVYVLEISDGAEKIKKKITLSRSITKAVTRFDLE